GSSSLVQNLEAGAPADVFASADEANMDDAQAAGLIETRTRDLFAANELVGVVPIDNPADVSTLEEANADDVKLVICELQGPCCSLSQDLAESASITLDAVTEEQHVSDVLVGMSSGQADAGLVYATDADLDPDKIGMFEIGGADDQLDYYTNAQT